MRTGASGFRTGCALALLALIAAGGEAQARVDGIVGTGVGSASDPRTFNLVAKDASLVTGDGNTVYAWAMPMHRPGPCSIRGRH